jgi:hypothetical protein
MWCSKIYTQTIDDIIHHKTLINKLTNIKYDQLQNMLFYGVKGCGKKSVVFAFINSLLISYFNITKNDITKTIKEIKCKTNKKYELFKYSKTKYYYIIDMCKLGKKRIFFFDQFLKYIIQSKNVLNLQFNLIIILNYDICDSKLINRFRRYSEKYYKYTRFICITNKPINATRLKLIGYNKIRVSRPKEKETVAIIKHIINNENASIKTHTISFENKMKKVFKFSNNHLAKSIFYAQLLLEFGSVQLKNIALRENRRFEHIYSLITSKNIKNLQDINKERNTTILTEPTSLKLKRMIYQCAMNTENYEKLILDFFKFLINKKPKFIKKYNENILVLMNHISGAHTNTNKTTFIIVECFFMKLMTMYSIDNINSK